MSIDKFGNSPYPDSPKNIFAPIKIADKGLTDIDRSYKNKGYECVWVYSGADSQQRSFEAVNELRAADIKAFIVENPADDMRRIWANPPSES